MLTETQWQQYEHKTARTGFFVQKRGEQSFWIVDQHGAKNKPQWARKTQAKVNVMNGGSL